MIPEVVRSFPWPKSMRWGSGRLTWVRPLHSIVATFGPETEEPDVVPFKVDGIAAGDETRGHRFMAPAPFKVRRFDDYVAKLEAAKVMLDPARRAETILTDAKNLAFAQGFELVEDDGLLAEVAGLVEWPVTLMGSFDEAFLAIPDEVIRATIRNNQKCFVLRDPQTAKLVNKFILVANEEASDGGKAIVAGNERVIRARLSDAKFFYDTDLKTRLEDRLPKFEHHRVPREARHAGRAHRAHRRARGRACATSVGADRAKAERAALLCKADLLTEVVGEFPELQGLMGRYYAEAQNEDEAVAHAIEDHYRPKGPDDLVPADPVAIAVALADKIDTLVGFWAIDEKPTGSKDPYALRRAALGVIRIVIENELRLPLRMQLWRHFGAVARDEKLAEAIALLHPLQEDIVELERDRHRARGEARSAGRRRKSRQPDRARCWCRRIPFCSRPTICSPSSPTGSKCQLREQGARHDLVDAVFALGGQDDLLHGRAPRRGARQIPRHRRRQEPARRRQARLQYPPHRGEEGQARATPARQMPSSSTLPEEKALAEAIDRAKKEASAAVAKEDFAAAMSAMAKLRPKVDAFFDKVTVNVDDKALARKPPQAAQRNPRSHPRGRRFLQDRGLDSLTSPRIAGEVGSRKRSG